MGIEKIEHIVRLAKQESASDELRLLAQRFRRWAENVTSDPSAQDAYRDCAEVCEARLRELDG